MQNSAMTPQLQYTWLNPIIMSVATAFLFAAVALVAFSFLTRRFSRRRLRWIALASLLIGLAAGASNYALIFFVQLPSYARQVKAADQQRRDAAAKVTLGQSVSPFRIKTLDG